MRDAVSAMTAGADRLARDGAHQRLAFVLRAGRRSQQRVQRLADAHVDVLRQRQVVQQTDAECFRGAEALAGEEQPPCRARADRLDDIRRDGGGYEPETRLREREDRILRADRDVAAGDEPDAAAKGRAVDPRDRRLGKIVERGQHRRQRARIGEILRARESSHALHPVQVGAGAKARARTGDDHGTHVVRLAEMDERGRELGDRRLVERVVYFGPVEHQRRHRVLDGELKRRRRGCVFAARFVALGCLIRPVMGYILNTPNVVGAMGLLSDADSASASTLRVSAGSITPSSQSRALA